MNSISNSFDSRATELPRFLEHDKNKPEQMATGLYYKNWRKLSRLEHVARDLMVPDFKPPFSGEFYGKPDRARKNLAAARVVRALRNAGLAMEERLVGGFWECHEICPEVDLIIKVVNAAVAPGGGYVEGVGIIAEMPYKYWQFELLDGEELIAAHDAINRMVMQLRTALMSGKMRDRIKNFKRNSKDRYKHLMEVATTAWTRKNNKNLLIRLDYGFKKSYPVVLPEFMSQQDFHLQCAEMCRIREKMLNILRKLFGEDLSFYAWKIECGDEKGLHIHWLLAVNGNKHQDCINVPRRICDAWTAAIGADNGHAFNVHTLNSAARSGLRVIGYDDPELLDVLGAYCDYLTKIDYTLKFRMPKGMRAFGCSKLVKVKKKKPGPARKHQMHIKNFMKVRGPQWGKTS